MKNPYPINKFLRFLLNIWLYFFVRKHKVKAFISDEIKNLDKPFLLLANHNGNLDPFIITYFMKKPVNYISSDAILRDKFIGTILKWFGAMPKKKGVRDTQIIREMTKVIQANGAIGLFPEGARTWSGETLYIDPSVVKLVRLLKVPVLSVLTKGGFITHPRWAKTLRKAKMELHYSIIIREDEIKTLPEDEILSRIKRSLLHDDLQFQSDEKICAETDCPAEYLDFVLFTCPSCLNSKGFNSNKDKVTCRNCNAQYKIDCYSILSPKGNAKSPFKNIKEWIDWQNPKFFSEFLKRANDASATDILLKSEQVHLTMAEGYNAMKSKGRGTISYFKDRIELDFEKHKETINIKNIDALNPQFQERLEMLSSNYAYRFTSEKIKEAGIKWEIATNALWQINNVENRMTSILKRTTLD